MYCVGWLVTVVGIAFGYVLDIFYCYLSLVGFLQAYTMELEAEVAKLKEDNEELRKKQVLSYRLFLYIGTHE